MTMAHRSMPAATRFWPAWSISAAVQPFWMAWSTASLPLSTPR